MAFSAAMRSSVVRFPSELAFNCSRAVRKRLSSLFEFEASRRCCCVMKASIEGHFDAMVRGREVLASLRGEFEGTLVLSILRNIG